MSSFWAGFAAEGARQLDTLQRDKRTDDKLAEARKYNEERYSLERADRKADSIEEFNVEQQALEATDFKGIFDAGGGNYGRRTMRRGADGNLVVETEQVKDQDLIKQYLEFDAAKKRKVEEDEWEMRGKKARSLKDEYDLSTAPEKHSLDMQRGRADIEASKRSNRGKDKDISGELPDYAYNAINGLAAGDGSYEYTGPTTYKGKPFKVRDMARIAADPTHPSHVGALVVMREVILPNTNKIKEEK